ncbi:hypothetical protein BD311DRAFT_244708 [Dichomitus squalens]|uniref:Cation efflux protein transmembrane domain-containing protein n=1 Tax=Dichomitus squalens TaxID=114155 RepID=A0A4Q9M6T6_9APHY|nr:hypothetical protein BD311DRAFT_244708 [Dichomitus squalens]
MESAALLTDTGHCLGELIGDFITLFSWRLSRQPPSETYSHGYGKFAVPGRTVVSMILTRGALGIELHSWILLVEGLSTATIIQGLGPLREVLARILDVAQTAVDRGGAVAWSWRTRRWDTGPEPGVDRGVDRGGKRRRGSGTGRGAARKRGMTSRVKNLRRTHRRLCCRPRTATATAVTTSTRTSRTRPYPLATTNARWPPCRPSPT